MRGDDYVEIGGIGNIGPGRLSRNVATEKRMSIL